MNGESLRQSNTDRGKPFNAPINPQLVLPISFSDSYCLKSPYPHKDPEQSAELTPAAANLKPEGTKSTSESLGDTLATAGDSVASYVPGQEKTRDNFTDDAHSHSLTHDTGRSAGGEAVKPAGGQGLMGSIEQKADKWVWCLLSSFPRNS